MRFEADPAWVPRSRHWVSGVAREQGAPEAVQRVVALLTSEVVTNAVKHGPVAGQIEVGARRDGDALRVTVTDGSTVPPAVRDLGPAALAGRGLMLVDVLAMDWGVAYHEGGGKSVWFRVRL